MTKITRISDLGCLESRYSEFISSPCCLSQVRCSLRWTKLIKKYLNLNRELFLYSIYEVCQNFCFTKRHLLIKNFNTYIFILFLNKTSEFEDLCFLFFVFHFHLVSPSWVNFTIFYLVSQKSEHIYLVVLELLSVQDESFCYFGNLTFLWLCCFCVRLSSCYHEFEEIFVSSYHSVIDLSFRFWENAVSNKFRVLFVIPCKGEEVVDIRNFTKVRTNGVHED